MTISLFYCSGTFVIYATNTWWRNRAGVNSATAALAS